MTKQSSTDIMLEHNPNAEGKEADWSVVMQMRTKDVRNVRDAMLMQYLASVSERTHDNVVVFVPHDLQRLWDNAYDVGFNQQDGIQKGRIKDLEHEVHSLKIQLGLQKKNGSSNGASGKKAVGHPRAGYGKRGKKKRPNLKAAALKKRGKRTHAHWK